MRIDSSTVIFITGGGSGFGLATAVKFYALGCKIILADISLTEEARQFIAKVSKPAEIF
jgi:NAD(P)-dependent dehydrogenase (short-subunit alcohol dehydrogenase family)